MATVSTNIKIESGLKEEAQSLFKSLGMNLSTAVNVFLRQAVYEQAIPFRIGVIASSDETIKAIENARHGIGLSKSFTSVSELMEALDADD